MTTEAEDAILDLISIQPGGLDHESIMRQVKASTGLGNSTITIAITTLVTQGVLEKTSAGKYLRSRHKRQAIKASAMKVAEVKPKESIAIKAATKPQITPAPIARPRGETSLRSRIIAMLEAGTDTKDGLAKSVGAETAAVYFHLRNLLKEQVVEVVGLKDRLHIYGLCDAKPTGDTPPAAGDSKQQNSSPPDLKAIVKKHALQDPALPQKEPIITLVIDAARGDISASIDMPGTDLHAGCQALPTSKAMLIVDLIAPTLSQLMNTPKDELLQMHLKHLRDVG